MIQTKSSKNTNAKLSEFAAHSPLQDFARNSRATLSSKATKRDWVTQKDFDCHAEFLLLTRKKMSHLKVKPAVTEEMRFRGS